MKSNLFILNYLWLIIANIIKYTKGVGNTRIKGVRYADDIKRQYLFFTILVI